MAYQSSDRYVTENAPGTGITQGEGGYVPGVAVYRNLDTGELLPEGSPPPTQDQIYAQIPNGQYLSITSPEYQAAQTAYVDSQSLWGDIGPGIMNSLAFVGGISGANALAGGAGMSGGAGALESTIGGTSGLGGGAAGAGAGAAGGGNFLSNLGTGVKDWASNLFSGTGTGAAGAGADLGAGTGWTSGYDLAGGGSLGGSGASGGSFLQNLFSGAKDFNKQYGGLPGNILGAAANYFTSGMTADKYAEAARKIQEGAKPLNDPQRQQYQKQLSDLQNNPTAFWQTNPVAMGQLDLAKNMFEARSGKLGSGGTQFSDYLKNVTNAASGTFNDQAQLLAGLGGFNMPAQGTNAGAQLMGQGIQTQGEQFRGIGNLFGSNLMQPQQTKTPTGPLQNPITGTTYQPAV